MGILDRHLALLLGLVTLTALAVALPRIAGDADAGAALHGLPPAVDGWVVTPGVPERVLPVDSRALETARWTYATEGRSVFVAIARYRSRNDPEWRPSVNQIAPEPGAISVSHERLAIDLGDVPGRAAPVNLVSVRRSDGHISVLYWYQVRDTTIADAYRLRMVLFVNALRLRGQEVWLVRIATSTSERPEDFVRAFYPRLVKVLSH